MYIPDPIERMEASAERWAEENIDGDKFLCGCGQWCPIGDGNTASSNPYDVLVCPKCMHELIEQWRKNDGD